MTHSAADTLIETELGRIPSSWRIRRFDEVLDSDLGKMLSRASKTGRGSRPYLRNANVQWGRVETTDVYEMDFPEEQRERFRLRSGDLLICEGGEVGRTAIWRGEIEECYYQKAIHRARPRDGRIDSEFFMYHMMHAFLVRKVYGIQGTTTTIAHLPAVKLKALPIPVPPLSEQRAIAHVLRTVQRAREATVKVIAAARQVKQSLMCHLFTFGSVAVDQADRVVLRETAFGSVPSRWSTSLLSQCADVQTGITKGRSIDRGDSIEVPYLRVANVQDGFLDLAEMKQIAIKRTEISRFSLQDGDVVLTEGGDFDKLGRGFVWRSEVPGCVHQNHIFAVRTHRDALAPDFLAYLTQSPYGKKYFLSVAHRTTHLACINSTKLKALPVPLPTEEEQRAIVGILRCIDHKLQVEERRLVSQALLFDSLLHNLMTGKVRVHDLNLAEVGVIA